MRALITLAIVSLGCAAIRPASANDLRCGSVLIEPGDEVGYVLEHCGEPNSSLPIPRSVSGPAPASYSGAFFRGNRWRYHRGPGKFPAILVIGDDGRVDSIHFDKHRD